LKEAEAREGSYELLEYGRGDFPKNNGNRNQLNGVLIGPCARRNRSWFMIQRGAAGRKMKWDILLALYVILGVLFFITPVEIARIYLLLGWMLGGSLVIVLEFMFRERN
jgi:hypothetical protein